jgi:hypothetical protein
MKKRKKIKRGLRPSVRVIGGWNGDGDNRREFIQAIKEILWPVIKTNVKIRIPHQYHHRPIRNLNFHIFIWSSPLKFFEYQSDIYRRERPPEKIWGSYVNCKDLAYMPSGLGKSFIDEASGYAVAELINGNNLYIHHDLVERGSYEEIAIFRELLRRVVDELLFHKKPDDKPLRKSLTTQMLISSMGDFGQSDLEQSVSRLDTDLRDLRTRLAKTIRDLQEKRTLLSLIKSGKHKTDRIEMMTKEYEDIISLPKVEEVLATKSYLKVFTKTIFCKDPDHPRHVYEIGKFLIRIPLDLTDKNGIRLINLTRFNGNMAPHVDSDGTPCLGNMEEAFPELLANCEFSVLTDMCIQFLEAYNSGNFQDIENWPRAKRGGGNE